MKLQYFDMLDGANFKPSGGTVIIDGSGTQRIRDYEDGADNNCFYDLELSGPDIAFGSNSKDELDVANNMLIGVGATFDFVGTSGTDCQLDVGGYMNNYGNITMNDADDIIDVEGSIVWRPGSLEDISTGKIQCGGYFYMYDTANFNPVGGTVELDGTGTQSIYDYEDGTDNNYFYNLELTGASTKFFHSDSNDMLNISNDFIINSGATFNFSGSSGTDCQATVGRNLDVYGSITMNDSDDLIDVDGWVRWRDNSTESISTGTLKCAGTFSMDNTANFNPSGGTVELDGTSTQNIYDYESGTDNNYFYDLTLTGASTKYFSAGSNSLLHISNDFIINSGANFDFEGTAGTDCQTQVDGNLDIYGSVTMDEGDDEVNVEGWIWWRGGSSETISTGTIKCAGQFHMDDTANFNPTGGTVELDGTGTQYIYDYESGTDNNHFYNLILAGSGTKYFGSNSYSSLHITNNFVINSGTNFNFGGSSGTDCQAQVDGNVNVYGSITLNDADDIIDIEGFMRWRPGSSEAISMGTIKCAGTFNLNAGAYFNPTGGKVELDGAGDQRIIDWESGTDYNQFYNLVASNGGYKYFDSDSNDKLGINGSLLINSGVSFGFEGTSGTDCQMDVAGDLTIYGELVMNNGGDYFKVGGHFTMEDGATFSPTGGTVELIGTGDQYIRDKETSNDNCFFYNLIIGGTGTAQHSTLSNSQLHVKNDFTINAGSTFDFLGTSGTDCQAEIEGTVWIYGTLIMDDSDDYILVHDGFRMYDGATFPPTTGTVEVTGTGDQYIFDGETTNNNCYFYNLILSGTGTKFFGSGSEDKLEIINDMTIQSGVTFDFSGNSGTDCQMDIGNFLKVYGSIKMNDGDDRIDVGGHIRWYDGSTETISSGIIFCGNNFYMENGANFNPTGGTVELDKLGDQTFIDLESGTNNNYFYNLYFGGSGTKRFGSNSNSQLDILNDLLIRSSTFFDFQGSSGTDCQMEIGDDLEVYGSFIMNDPDDRVIVNGNMNWQSGGAEIISNGIITCFGNHYMFSGASFSPTGGEVNLAKNGDQFIHDLESGTNNNYYYNLQLSGGGTKYFDSSSNDRLDIQGSLTIGSGVTFDLEGTNGKDCEMIIGNDLLIYGTLTMNDFDDLVDVGDDVIWYEDSSGAISGGILKCGGDLTISPNISNDLIINGASIVMDGTGTHYIDDQDSGNTSFYDLEINMNNGVCYLASADLLVRGDLSILSGELNSARSPASVNRSNITVEGNILVQGTFQVSGGNNSTQVFCGGSWDSYGGVFNAASGQVFFTGNQSYTVKTAPGNHFHDLEFAGNFSRVQALSGLVIQGNLSINNNSTLLPGTYGHSIYGNWDDSGGFFFDNASSVFFMGDISEIKTGKNNHFHTLVITIGSEVLTNSSEDIEVTHLLEVSGNLTIRPGMQVSCGNLSLYGILDLETSLSKGSILSFTNSTDPDLIVYRLGKLYLRGSDADHRAVIQGDEDSRIAFDISGTFEGGYYSIISPDEDGLHFSGNPSIISLDNGLYDLPAPGGVLLDLSSLPTLPDIIEGCIFNNGGESPARIGPWNVRSDQGTDIVGFRNFTGDLASDGLMAESFDKDDVDRVFWNVQVTFRTSTNGTLVLNGSNHAVVTFSLNGVTSSVDVYDLSGGALWTDCGHEYIFSHQSSGSQNSHRWHSNLTIDPDFQGTVPAQGIIECTYFEQWKLLVFLNGTDVIHNVTVYFYQAGIALNISGQSVNWTGWVDVNRSLRFDNTTSGSNGNERWMCPENFDNAPWVSILNASNLTLEYYHQFKPVISLEGTVPGNEVELNYTVFGLTIEAKGLHSNWSEWVDAGSKIEFSQLASGSSSFERWITSEDFTQALWEEIPSAFYKAVFYQHQYFTILYLDGTDQDHNVTLNYTYFGSNVIVHNQETSWSGWVDKNTILMVDQVTSGTTSTERRQTLDDEVSHTVSEPLSVTIKYYHQFLMKITVQGIDEFHTVDLVHTSFGDTQEMKGLHSSWSGWVDAGSALTLTNTASGSNAQERWLSQEDFSLEPWAGISSALDKTIVFHHQYFTTINLLGTDQDHNISISFVSFGVEKGNPNQHSNWSGWVDADTSFSLNNTLTSSNNLERWYTPEDFTSDIWSNVNRSFSVNLTYYHQWLVTFKFEKMNNCSDTTVIDVLYWQYGLEVYGQADEEGTAYWCDANTDYTYMAASVKDAEKERWFCSSVDYSGKTTASRVVSPQYYHQKKITKDLDGSDEDNLGSVSYYLAGEEIEEEDLHGSWEDWCDCPAEVSFQLYDSDENEGGNSKSSTELDPMLWLLIILGVLILVVFLIVILTRTRKKEEDEEEPEDISIAARGIMKKEILGTSKRGDTASELLKMIEKSENRIRVVYKKAAKKQGKRKGQKTKPDLDKVEKDLKKEKGQFQELDEEIMAVQADEKEIEVEKEPIIYVADKSVTCKICFGVIKTGLPVLECRCGKKYHDTCAQRLGSCTACDLDLDFDTIENTITGAGEAVEIGDLDGDLPTPDPDEEIVDNDEEPNGVIYISDKSITCKVCHGVIKTGLPILECRCGKKYHDNCARRIGSCPSCEADYNFDLLEEKAKFTDIQGDLEDDDLDDLMDEFAVNF